MQAQKIAQQKATALGTSISEQNIQQAKARGRGAAMSQQTTPYYIFNFNDSTGYAIIGGDDRMPSIVGYSDRGTLNPDSLPANLKSFLIAYKATVEAVEKGDTIAVKNVKSAMTRVTGSYTPIPPLLGGIAWNQHAPFNNLCPKYEGENRSVTGCTATAMAQIMRYWKWPITLQNDIPGYSWRGLQLETIPKGFIYDWDNMLDNDYVGEYTDVQATAVASLMLHAGISIRSKYTAGGTAAIENNVPDALTTYFGYDKQTIVYLERQDFEWDEWNKILQKELFLKRPIFYGGVNENNTIAHAFICDGIDSEGYYHINWGQSSSENGYFDITILNYEYDKSHKDEFQNDGYCYSNTAIIGIQPADGQEHEAAFSFDRFYVSFGGVRFEEAYRKNSTDAFNRSYMYGYVSSKTTFNIPVVWLAIGEKDESGNLVKISTESVKIETRNISSDFSVEIPINYAFPNGTHRLVFIQSIDEGKTWQVCYGKGHQTDVYVTEYEIFNNDSRYKKFKLEGINYQVDRMENCASVTKGNNSGNIVIPEFVNYDGVDYPVLSISSGCFAYCDKIESVFIPKSVESLGRKMDNRSYFYNGCFQECTNLKEVIFEKGSKLKMIGGYCFAGCKNLKSIEIPDGVEILSAAAITNCISLTSVSLPNTLKEIGRGCFYGCESLMAIDIPDGVTEMPDQCFNYCTSLADVKLPKNVNKIGVQCFQYCSSLVSIIIPEGIPEIPKYCFEGCSSLVSIVLPNSLREIGNGCFERCSSLPNIVLQEGVLKISERCFAECSALGSVNLSTSEKIGESCFFHCTNLTDVVMSEGVRSLGKDCFNGCSSLTNINLPNSLREIGTSCFYSCEKLQCTVEIPEGVVELPEKCFYKCYALNKIKLPSTLRKLGGRCLYFCSSLTEISLPESISEIGEDCFYSCKNLTDVVMSEGVRSLGNDCFKNCSSLTNINLPNSLREIGTSCFYSCI